jgi:hypothetical protein
VGYTDAAWKTGTEMPAKFEGKDFFDHAKRINEIFYDQIKISDQKAAYIFTFILAFMISSAEGRGVFAIRSYSFEQPLTTLFSFLLAMSSIFSLVSAIMVILPRRSRKTTTLFWGDWLKHRETFVSAAMRADQDYLFQQYLDNADTLALIARSKYRFVSFAFRGLVATVLSYVGLLLSA